MLLDVDLSQSVLHLSCSRPFLAISVGCSTLAAVMGSEAFEYGCASEL